MKIAIKYIIRTAIGLSALMLTLLALLLTVPRNTEYQSTPSSEAFDIRLTSDADKVSVKNDNGSSDYTIIFSTDTITLDSTFASTLRTVLSRSGTELAISADTVSANLGEYEILIGKTNRPESEELLAMLEKKCSSPYDIAYGYAVIGNKILFLANSEFSFELGQDEFLTVLTENDFSLDADLCVIYHMTYEEWRAQRIAGLKEAIGGFDLSDFTEYPELGYEYTIMPDGTHLWGTPALYPEKGEHPRVNVTSYMLDSIREYVNTTVEGKNLYFKLMQLANEEYDGILSEPTEHTTGRKGFHNIDERGMAIIESKAFVYLLTGDEMYGYEAVLAMKNYLKTLMIGYVFSDQCRDFGKTLVCIAEVYDWCYDLLDEEDKKQFIVAATDICSGSCAKNYGGEYKGKCSSGDLYMEVGYPPSGQGAVTGHGCEAQILRDYLTVSIAIFDENPSWYNYVGARVYNDFIPFRNYYFQSGTYGQGVTVYGPHRHSADLWSAWLIFCATGENPYTDDLQRVTNSFYAHELPNGTFFASGDGNRLSTAPEKFMYCAVLVSALYGDSGMRERYKDFYDGDMLNVVGDSLTMTFAHHTVLGARYYDLAGSTAASEPHATQSNILYMGSSLGQYIARSEWNDPDSPAVLMYIGEKSTSNHEHADRGTFQIYYKGLYTGDSGLYDKYASKHWKYYHQQTVAHNGILIFDPNLADSEMKYDESGAITNLERVYYSGGQRHFMTVGKTFDSWLYDENLDTGTVVGHEDALKKDGTADYVYLEGDITKSYLSTQTSYVGRGMFTLFTADEKYPMLLLVYDDIDVATPSHITKFLLHTPSEPVIDEEAGTVSVTSRDGRLVLNALGGTDEYVPVGGENMNYAINGVQCVDTTTGNDRMWGRVELHSSGKTNVEFLNAIYVTDAENDEKLEFSKIENEHVIGTKTADNIIVFTKSRERSSEALSFVTEGDGLQRYFILGLYDGSWNVKVDGVTIAHCVSSLSGGMISFYAPSGNITVEPGRDIAIPNGGRIAYAAFGGIVPDDAPIVYEIGVPISLPTNVKRGDDTFVGWYTSPTFEEDSLVRELVATDKGTVTLYAKYISYPIKEEYEDRDFELIYTSETVGSIMYVATSAEGCGFTVVNDEEDGNKYLSVYRSKSTMQMAATEDYNTFYSESDTRVTYEIDLALNGDLTPLVSTFNLREKSSNQISTLFSTAQNGNVMLGNTVIATLSEDFRKIIVTVDFENATVSAYDKYGNEIATTALVISDKASTSDPSEWVNTLGFIFYWYMTGGTSILADNIKVYTGDYISPYANLPHDTNIILYNDDIGRLPNDAPEFYRIGETLTLPTPSSDSGEFIGWYTTPTFEKGTEIDVISADSADEPITVYAKYLVRIFEDDFTDSTVDVTEADITVNDIRYQTTKAGSYAKAETDSSGNTYIKIYTEKNDTSVISYAPAATAATAGGGKITYEISLATHADGRIGVTQFRPRGAGGSKDVVNIFTTTTAGAVLLAGDEALRIGTLSTDFAKFIFTLDIYAATVTAYDVYGTELASSPVSVPSVSSAETFADWFSATTFCFNWYFSSKGGILFDDLKMYSGEYISPEGLMPENSGVIIYNTASGTLPEGYPEFYTAGEATVLPTPTLENAAFSGWFTSPTFEEETRISEILKDSADGAVKVYAKFVTLVFDEDFTASTVSVELEQVTVDGITYALSGKNGSVAKAETDASGNKYLRIYTDGMDATVSYKNESVGALVSESGGCITYEIDIATLEEGRIGENFFRVRGKDGASDTLLIFKTTKDAKLLLGGTLEIGDLDAEFTKYVFTLDTVAQTLTAYNAMGEELGRVDVCVPETNAANYETVADWFNSVLFCFNIQLGVKGGIALDNIKIYTDKFTV